MEQDTHKYPNKRILIVEDRPTSMSQAICGCSYIADELVKQHLASWDAIYLTRAVFIDRLKNEKPYDLIISSADYYIDKDRILQLRELFPSTKIARQIECPGDDASEEFKQLPYITSGSGIVETFKKLFSTPKKTIEEVVKE